MTKHEDDVLFDEEMEQRIKSAFDEVGPSQEAEGRMLANLLAYQRERSDAATATASATDQAPVLETPNASTDASGVQGQGVQPSTPKARIVHPWKMIVPAAAALALVGIGVLAATTLSGTNASTADSAKPAAQSVQEAAKEDAAEPAARDAAAEAQNTNAETQDSAAEKQSGAGAAAESNAAPSEAAADYAGADQREYADSAAAPSEEEEVALLAESAVEQGSAANVPDPNQFPEVVLSSGTVLAVDSRPADRSDVGELLEETIAASPDGLSEAGCTVFASQTDKDQYYVVYEGSTTFYPARAA